MFLSRDEDLTKILTRPVSMFFVATLFLVAGYYNEFFYRPGVSLTDILAYPVSILFLIMLFNTAGFYISRRKIFSNLARGYGALIIAIVVYSGTGDLISLLTDLAPSLIFKLLVPSIVTMFAMSAFFILLLDNLKLSVVLAISTIFPAFIFPVFFSQIAGYILLHIERPIGADLTYWSLVSGFLLTGFIWGIVLYKLLNHHRIKIKC